MTLISPQRSWSSEPGTEILDELPVDAVDDADELDPRQRMGEELRVQRGAVAILAAVAELGEVGGDRLGDVRRRRAG